MSGLEQDCVVVVLDSNNKRRQNLEKRLAAIVGEGNVVAPETATRWPAPIRPTKEEDRTPVVVFVHGEEVANLMLDRLVHQSETSPAYRQNVVAVVAYKGDGGAVTIKLEPEKLEMRSKFPILLIESDRPPGSIPVLSVQPGISENALQESDLLDILQWCLACDRETRPLPEILAPRLPWVPIAKLLLQGYLASHRPGVFPELEAHEELLEAARRHSERVGSMEYWKWLSEAMATSSVPQSVEGVLAELRDLLKRERGIEVPQPKTRDLDDQVEAIWRVLCK